MDVASYGVNGRDEPPNGAQRPNVTEMQKVRDLLFGEAQRVTEQRLQLMERRLGDIEGSIASQLRQITRRLDEISVDMPANQRAAMLSLSRAVSGLGEEIARLAIDDMPGAANHAHKTE